ncbi:hypothetical protein NFJ02_11g05870 [Pycnococcus provasolii]|mmetsp:Transcript_14086/g.35303  ORF Transcript_14086/g.35303 Transcript_14086/m.35303 type:complete len:209 (+) Transcript_14086:84-710(+)|eukprot:CAMPEP_0119195980 /NCGR_PEP_ID=MMETSP1316-20130426/8192_1 /TAXON_ID=41880 /ORGANISM="Pycnococcus provasolii, Strain RCC2336" /LENGTH=208 /DNA_ID=CAMNT_0007191577 /DNA_START=45 /DNA_END=671 /DNA_ORIENTATION=-
MASDLRQALFRQLEQDATDNRSNAQATTSEAARFQQEKLATDARGVKSTGARGTSAGASGLALDAREDGANKASKARELHTPDSLYAACRRAVISPGEPHRRSVESLPRQNELIETPPRLPPPLRARADDDEDVQRPPKMPRGVVDGVDASGTRERAEELLREHLKHWRSVREYFKQRAKDKAKMYSERMRILCEPPLTPKAPPREET